MAGKSNKGAMRLLRLKGQVWWFRRNVPAACVSAIGKLEWILSLATSDIKVAKVRRDELEAETTRLFANIQSGKPVEPEATSPALRGHLWRETVAALSETNDSEDTEELDLARHAEEAEREALRAADKRAFDDARLGRVPVDHYIEAYLGAAKVAPKTALGRRGLVKKFAAWCTDEKLTLDKINRKIAGRYVTAMTPKAVASTVPPCWRYRFVRVGPSRP